MKSCVFRSEDCCFQKGGLHVGAPQWTVAISCCCWFSLHERTEVWDGLASFVSLICAPRAKQLEKRNESVVHFLFHLKLCSIPSQLDADRSTRSPVVEITHYIMRHCIRSSRELAGWLLKPFRSQQILLCSLRSDFYILSLINSTFCMRVCNRWRPYLRSLLSVRFFYFIKVFKSSSRQSVVLRIRPTLLCTFCMLIWRIPEV